LQLQFTISSPLMLQSIIRWPSFGIDVTARGASDCAGGSAARFVVALARSRLPVRSQFGLKERRKRSLSGQVAVFATIHHRTFWRHAATESRIVEMSAELRAAWVR
jgi:hypothetical protein